MFTTRRLFRGLGGFDMQFENQFFDVDFCLRAGGLEAPAPSIPTASPISSHPPPPQSSLFTRYDGPEIDQQRKQLGVGEINKKEQEKQQEHLLATTIAYDPNVLFYRNDEQGTLDGDEKEEELIHLCGSPLLSNQS